MASQRHQQVIEEMRVAAREVILVHAKMKELQENYDALGGKPSFDAHFSGSPQEFTSDEFYGAIVSVGTSALSPGDKVNFLKIRR